MTLFKNSDPEARKGLLYGLVAYLIWGFFPVYFKSLSSVPPLQVVSHRIVWSLLFLTALISSLRNWQEFRSAFSECRSILLLALSALLIAINWLVFIMAVDHAQVLQSSLGYFISPFVSIALGALFLKERLRPLQLTSLVLAATGVMILTIRLGSFPWTALILGVTFGSYGMLRKIVKVDSLPGLTIETLLLAPFALCYLFYAEWQGGGAFLHTTIRLDILLLLAGVVTALPLLFFAAAARRLRLATIGFMQYLTPTIHFLLAVLLYHEPLSGASLISFLFIWTGLVFYSWDASRRLG